MPGASLWLLPPEGHPLAEPLGQLIESTLPAAFGLKVPKFVPHITLDSGVMLQDLCTDPKTWLDEIEAPVGDTVCVEFGELARGSTYTKRLFIRCHRAGDRAAGLRLLAGKCRSQITANKGAANDQSAMHWAQEEWDPHLSLMYTSESISDLQFAEAVRLLGTAGVRSPKMTGPEARIGQGWTGGRMWLVDTARPIEEWSVVAVRNLC